MATIITGLAVAAVPPILTVQGETVALVAVALVPVVAGQVRAVRVAALQ